TTSQELEASEECRKYSRFSVPCTSYPASISLGKTCRPTNPLCPVIRAHIIPLPARTEVPGSGFRTGPGDGLAHSIGGWLQSDRTRVRGKSECFQPSARAGCCRRSELSSSRSSGVQRWPG